MADIISRSDPSPYVSTRPFLSFLQLAWPCLLTHIFCCCIIPGVFSLYFEALVLASTLLYVATTATFLLVGAWEAM